MGTNMSKKEVKSKASSQFPNIYRFITEKIKIPKKELNNLMLGFVFGVILVSLVFFSLDLLSNLREKSSIDAKQQNLKSQVGYWQQVVGKQKGYRDGYFMLSVLEYQLKNLDKSENYLKMVLSIDPNFGPALEFEKILNKGI